MTSLLAIDLPLGLELELALRQCVERSQPFCVLDHRASVSRRHDELRALGATHILDSAGERRLEGGREVDDDIGLVMLTSGSSGTPKAAELTWGALIASATITQESLQRDASPAWFPCLPAHHIGGLAVLLRALWTDARLVWGDSRDISNAPSRGATHVALVRAQLFNNDVSGFDAVLLGGARPPGELAQNVIASWGMTETGSGVIYNGRALPGVEVASIEGELCIKSPTLFRSYRHAPRPRVHGPDGDDDWFPTGDAAEVNDGVVSVRGRLGYVINTGGEKVWPDDLEAVLGALEGVHDVAVTAQDDDVWGQRVIALVVSASHDLDAQIRLAAEERIGPWAKPKGIYYVPAIPRTSNGKIRRDALAGLIAS